jgi:hypothetical protein
MTNSHDTIESFNSADHRSSKKLCSGPDTHAPRAGWKQRGPCCRTFPETTVADVQGQVRCVEYVMRSQEAKRWM